MRYSVGYDILIYAFSKAIPGVLGFINILIIIRLLGKQQYGIYAIFISATNMFSAFSCKWICQSILRYYKIYENDCFFIRISSYFGVTIASLVSLCVLSVFFIPGINVPVVNIWSFFVILVVSTIVLSFYSVDLSLNQASLNPKRIVYLEASRSFTGIIFLVLFSFFSHSFMIAALSFFLAVFIAWGISNVQIAKYGKTFDGICWHSRLAEYKVVGGEILIKFWHFGWPLSFWFLCVGAIQVTDRYLIQFFYSVGETGAYASIYDMVIRSYSLFLFPVTMAVHPRIMNMWNEGSKDQAFLLIKKSIALQVFISLPMLLAYYLGRDLLADFLLPGQGDNYKDIVLPIAFGGGLWQLALLIHKPLEIAGKTLLMLVAISLALFTNIVGNYFLLPVLGIVASAYTTILSSFVYFFVCTLFSHRYARMNAL